MPEDLDQDLRYALLQYGIPEKHLDATLSFVKKRIKEENDKKVDECLKVFGFTKAKDPP